jgi:hypothetical protein
MFTDVSEVLAASIIRAISVMMEAASTYETPVNFHQNIQGKIPDDSHLQGWVRALRA